MAHYACLPTPTPAAAMMVVATVVMMVAAATPATSVVVVMTATPPTAAAGWRHCTLVLLRDHLPLRQILLWFLPPRRLSQGHLQQHAEKQNCQE
ncbi:hypothetical protein AAHC03_022938 [Spirometra sp. Aus1]